MGRGFYLCPLLVVAMQNIVHSQPRQNWYSSYDTCYYVIKLKHFNKSDIQMLATWKPADSWVTQLVRYLVTTQVVRLKLFRLKTEGDC